MKETMQSEKKETSCYYTEQELMTVKEAVYHLKVSRFTISRLREKGELTSVYRNRQVRLIRTEVEKAYRWYSVPKGKV
ncbi:DNA binding domain-containing protein, excisionase family [bacterium A37T11]|nr:DNA binding domain-containing protein, excisionase family [bacterium A37T11]